MHAVYEFGAFRLDPAERLLLRDGQPVSLTPKAFDLLVYLVEHQGRLVEKATLMAALWPDTIVEEANLAFQVSALRKVLEDGSNGDPLIQTVPTRGYRFTAPVTVSGPAPGSWNRRLLAGAAIVLVSGAIATAVWVILKWITPVAPPAASTSAPVFTPLTANPAEVPVHAQAISPDGNYLAYSDRTGIHVEMIDSGDVQTLPQTRGMEVSGWSADGTKIRAIDDRPVRRIWDVSLVGSARRPTGLVWPEGGVSLAPDGSCLLNQTQDGDLRVEPVHGSPRSVLRLAKDDGVRSAVWTPDATRVFFVRFMATDLRPGDNALETFPVRGGSPSVVFTAPRGQVIRVIGPPGREGRLLAVLGPRGRLEDNKLWEIPVNVETGTLSSAPRQLTDLREYCDQITRSADGRRVALLTGRLQRDVYVAAFDVRTARLDTPQRLTMSDRDDYPTAWTPDNRGVIFSSSRSGRQRDIYRQDIDRGEPELLVTGEGEKDYTRVTGDGRWMLFIQSGFPSPVPVKPTRVMRAPIEGGIAQEIYASPGIAWPQCSVGKSCIVYDMRGDKAVISSLDPISGKGAELATVPTSYSGYILPDGTEFAYIVDQDRPRTHIRVISFVGKPPKDIIVPGANELENLDPLPDGSGWFSVNHTSERTELLYITRDGRSHMLWAPDRTPVDSAMSSRDGKHLAIYTYTATSNVWMITRF